MNRYESYTESGFEWVGEIPKHWEVLRSKFLFRNKSEKNFPEEPLLSVTQKDGVVVRSESEMNVWNPTDDVSGYKLIEQGDFVISLRSFEGGLELSKARGIVSPAYTVLKTQKKIDDHYFWRLMKSHRFIIELNKHVTGIRQGKNIGWDDFSNIYLTIPHLQEQKLISRYLDQKTEQIDSLVEKIQKKIELLKEQRTSLINQCVTKGLDPKAPMQDSGVEWIGEIPRSWEVKKLKFLGERKSGNGFKVELQGDKGGDFPFYKVSDTNNPGNEKYLKVSNNYLDSETVEENKFRLFRESTIVFPKIGEVLKLNKRRILTKRSCIDNNMMGLTIHTDDNIEYIYLTLTLINFDLYCSDGAIPSISETQVSRIPIPIPPSKNKN